MNTNFNDAFQPSQLQVDLDDDEPVKGGITEEKEPEVNQEIKEEKKEEEKNESKNKKEEKKDDVPLPLDALQADDDDNNDNHSHGILNANENEDNNDDIYINKGDDDQPKKKCDECQEFSSHLQTFTLCEHQICPECYYRNLFLNEIETFGKECDTITIKCSCAKKGMITSTLDEILDMLQYKAEKDKQGKPATSDNLVKCPSHGRFEELYCMTCKKSICKMCTKEETHTDHRIFEHQRIKKKIQNSIEETQGILEQQQFTGIMSTMNEVIKESVEKGLNPKLKEIDDCIQTMLNYRKELEETFKQRLTTEVKKIKILKLLYLNYYYEREQTKTTKDIKLLLFVNSLRIQFMKIDMTWKDEIEKNVILLKNQVSTLKKNLNFRLFEYQFHSLQVGYQVSTSQTVTNIHQGNSVPCLIQTKDQRIITGAFDFNIKVWEEDNNSSGTYKKTFTIDKMTGAVQCLLQLKDGRLASSANNENTIKIWNEQNGRFIFHTSLSAHNGSVTSIIQLPDGKLVTGGRDKVIIIWKETDDFSFVESMRLPEENDFISILHVMKDKSFISSANNYIMKIYKEKDDESTPGNPKFALKQTIQFFKRRVKAVCQLSDGRLAAGGEDKVIILFALKGSSFVPCQKLPGHKSDVNTIIECFDGRMASSSRDRNIIIWKMGQDAKFFNEMHIDYPHGLYPLIQLQDGRLVSISSDKAMVVFNSRETLFY